MARHVNAALDSLGLRGYPKTSGATGVQIFVPVAPGHTYEQTRGVAGAIARLIVAADPGGATLEWDTAQRGGKVFIDYKMNRRAASLASVYAVRPEPAATVSTPLTWHELDAGASASDFTIATIHERLAATGDLFAPVLEGGQDLHPILGVLGLSDDLPAASSLSGALRGASGSLSGALRGASGPKRPATSSKASRASSGLPMAAMAAPLLKRALATSSLSVGSEVPLNSATTWS